MTEYEKLIRKLVTMDEKQLLEMYHDMLVHGTLADIERIADTAYHFVENYEEPESEDTGEKSDEEDWKEQDDAQRYRDIKSTQDSYK